MFIALWRRQLGAVQVFSDLDQLGVIIASYYAALGDHRTDFDRIDLLPAEFLRGFKPMLAEDEFDPFDSLE
jgi:hypothetical protein